MPDYTELKRLLNGPYTAVDDVKPKNDFEVGIYLKLPYYIDNLINVGIMCVGRYELTGNGKSTVAEIITDNLDNILGSLEWADDLPDDIIKRNLVYNFVFVSDNHQYFTTSHGVYRRSDDSILAVRNWKTEMRTYFLRNPPRGYLLSDELAASKFEITNMFNTTKELTNWFFPLYAWTDVEGVYRGDTTFIADVNADRVMVPDLFCSQVGTVELMPVYVKAKGTQTNYLSKALWYILNSIFPSQRDNDNVLAKKVKFVKNFGNKKELGEYTNLDMVAKIDYWKGKVLRVVYLREGTQPINLQIGDTMDDGSRVEKFLVGHPQDVWYPLSLTTFDTDFRQKKYYLAEGEAQKPGKILSSDVDIIREEEFANIPANGCVVKFKIVSNDGTEENFDEFALLGDHVSIKDPSALPLGKSSDFYKDTENMAASKPKDIIIDNLSVQYFEGDKIVEENYTSFEMTADNKYLIRRIMIQDFDDNLNPKSIKIETDGTKSIEFRMGFAKDDTFWNAIRYTVPSDDDLKKLEDEYGKIGEQMEKKAEVFRKDIKKWRTGIQQEIYEDVKSFVKISGKDGISGITMINFEDLDEGKDVTLKGVSK